MTLMRTTSRSFPVSTMDATTTTTTSSATRRSTSTKKNSNKKDAYALWITYLNIVLYALCYQLQRPVEPFLVDLLSKQHDPDVVAKTYGRLQSFFSLIQTIGSPLVGILLDRIGIRNASALVFLASACSYTILASATTMHLLFISKIPTALQHAFLVAQAMAATATGDDDSARAQALGRMTTAYTIGATIGPALGGYLAGNLGDLYLSAKLAVVGSLVSVLLSLLFLPNDSFIKTTHEEEEHDLDHGATNKQQQHHDGGGAGDFKSSHERSSSTFWNDLKHSTSIVFRYPLLLPLLVVKVFGGVSASMYSTVIPMVLTQDLTFSPAMLGIIMSSGMLAVATLGAVGMAPLTKFCRGGVSGMTRFGLCLRAVLVLVMATIITHRGGLFLRNENTSNSSTMITVLEKQTWLLHFQVIITSVLYDLSSHALATGLTTQTTGTVDTSEQGALLGLEHGLFSLARVGGPPLGTYMLVTCANHFSSVAMMCGAMDLSLVALLIMCSSSLSRSVQGPQRQERKYK